MVCITPNDPDGKLPNGIVVNGIAITPPVANGSLASKHSHRKSMDKGPDRDRNDSESRKTAHAHTNGLQSRTDDKKGPPNGVLTKQPPDDRKSAAGCADKKQNGSVGRPCDEKKANGSVHPDLEYNERLPYVFSNKKKIKTGSFVYLVSVLIK